MPSLTLPFGTAGLDRLSGEMAARPGSLRDVRNLLLRGARLQVAPGAVVTAVLPEQGGEPCAHVCLLEPLRFEKVAVAVGYYEGSRELHVYRLTAAGTDPAHVGLLGTLDEHASTPPRLHGAEVGGRLFIAHDEPLQSRRLATHVYNPLGSEPLTALEADFDGTGAAPVRFRGVLAWRDYLAGWGFASAIEARPEIVRVSLPGRPLEFDAEHYFIAGTQGDPVLSLRPAGGHLLALKASQTYRIHGSSHLDFGILPLHALTGALSHALTLEIDGRCYAWSAEGPVRLVGAVDPERLEEPLNLTGPQPEDFIGLDYEGGYVQYHPATRVVEWVFGGAGFALDLTSHQWSYTQSAIARSTGSLLVAGASLAEATGVASDVHVEEDVLGADGARDVTLAWTNVGMAGDEVLEFWLHDGEAWAQVDSVLVGPDATQDHTLADLPAGRACRFQIRARRGTLYPDGYDGADPDEWPTGSLLEYTTEITPPAIVTSSWERLSAEDARLTFEVDVSHPALRLELLRDGAVVDFADPPLEGPVTLHDDGVPRHEEYDYVVRQVTADMPEGGAADPVTRWAGPTAPTAVVFDGGSPENLYWYRYDVSWHARAGRNVRIQDDYACADEFATRHVGESDGFESITSLEKNSSEQDAGDNGGPAGFTARIRHEVTAHGVTDVSPWVSATVVVRIADDEDAFRACGGGDGGGNGGGGGDPDPVEPE